MSSVPCEKSHIQSCSLICKAAARKDGRIGGIFIAKHVHANQCTLLQEAGAPKSTRWKEASAKPGLTMRSPKWLMITLWPGRL